MTNELADKRLQLAITFIIGYALVDLAVSPLVGALTFALWQWPFEATTLGGLFVGCIAIANAWVSALADVQWMLVQTVAAERDHRDAETERINAEAEAIKNSSAAQIAIASGGSTIKQTIKPITYRVDGQVVNGNQLNEAWS